MPHPLLLERSIRDPIYGMVGLTSEELSVIDHPLFRRLHAIRQNGLLNLVWPSATHTRFEHSIGVVYVADSILQALRINSRVAARKDPSAVAHPDNAKVSQAIDFSLIPREQIQSIFRVGRLAALVHDLGHGPFSHHFEPFAPKAALVRQLVEEEASLGALRDLLKESPGIGQDDLFPRASASHEPARHEVLSAVLFAKIGVDLSLQQDLIRDVAATILGRPDLSMTPGLAPFLSLLHDLVASAPADADRMDYLERDSRSFGVSYGLYDRPRLLKSFLAFKQTNGDTPGYRLGIKQSGLRAVENFIQARFELHVQVYYHKANRAIQLMLGTIADKVRGGALSPFAWSDMNSLATTFRDLTDERFLDVLRGVSQTWPLEHTEVNELARRIYERRLWKRVYEGPDHHRFLDLLNNRLPRADIVADDVDPHATKDLKSGARPLKRATGGIYEALDGTSWLELSPIMKALAEDESHISRIYMCSGDREMYRQLREEAWRLQGAQ